MAVDNRYHHMSCGHNSNSLFVLLQIPARTKEDKIHFAYFSAQKQVQMSDNNLNKFNCLYCGVPFGLDKDVEETWRKTNKDFYCPNGHQMVFSDSSAHEKELHQLRDSVGKLNGQLTDAQTNAATLKKRAEELQAELELWKPRTKE